MANRTALMSETRLTFVFSFRFILRCVDSDSRLFCGSVGGDSVPMLSVQESVRTRVLLCVREVQAQVL